MYSLNFTRLELLALWCTLILFNYQPSFYLVLCSTSCQKNIFNQSLITQVFQTGLAENWKIAKEYISVCLGPDIPRIRSTTSWELWIWYFTLNYHLIGMFFFSIAINKRRLSLPNNMLFLWIVDNVKSWDVNTWMAFPYRKILNSVLGKDDARQ